MIGQAVFCMRFGYFYEHFAPNVLTYHDKCVIIAIIGRIFFVIM